MASRLLDIEFIQSAKTIYVNGRRYTHSEFEKAQQLEKRRSKNGRFENSNKKKF